VEVSWTPLAQASPGSRQDRSVASEGLGKDTFLKLFLTELRYQDPLTPADGKTFLTELALFSVVESVLKLTELVQEIHDRLEGSSGSPASSVVESLPPDA